LYQALLDECAGRRELPEVDLQQLMDRPLARDESWDEAQQSVVQATWVVSDEMWRKMQPHTLLLYFVPEEAREKFVDHGGRKVPAAPHEWGAFYVSYAMRRGRRWRVYGHHLEHQRDQQSYLETMELLAPFELRPRSVENAKTYAETGDDRRMVDGAELEELDRDDRRLVDGLKLYIPPMILEQGKNMVLVPRLDIPPSLETKDQQKERLEKNKARDKLEGEARKKVKVFVSSGPPRLRLLLTVLDFVEAEVVPSPVDMPRAEFVQHLQHFFGL